MRFRFRACHSWSLLLFLLAGPFSPPVGAGTATISSSYTGLVGGLGSGSGNVPSPPAGMVDGNSLGVQFNYLTTQTATTPGIYNFTTTGAELEFVITYFTNGTPQGPGTAESFQDEFKSGDLEVKMAKVGSGSTMTIIAAGANTLQGGNITLTLESTSYNSIALPTTTTQFATFVTASHKPMLVYDNFTFTSPLTNTFLSGPSVAVPEPSTLMLSLVAMASGTAVLMVSRFKARGFSLRSARPSAA
jgi:hypothetical protein